MIFFACGNTKQDAHQYGAKVVHKMYVWVRLLMSWDHRSLPVQSLSMKNYRIKFLLPHSVLPQQNPKPSSQSFKNNIFVYAAGDSNHQPLYWRTVPKKWKNCTIFDTKDTHRIDKIYSLAISYLWVIVCLRVHCHFSLPKIWHCLVCAIGPHRISIYCTEISENGTDTCLLGCFYFGVYVSSSFCDVLQMCITSSTIYDS